MKFKLITAILGMTMTIPGAVFAQYSDGQMQGQTAKPSPNIPMDAPNDQNSMPQDQIDQRPVDQGSMGQGSMNQGPNGQDSMGQGAEETEQDIHGANPGAANPNQGSMNQGPPTQGPMDPGPNDANSNEQTYNTPAPEEKNGVARISLIHGDVSTQRGDSKDWSAAALNAPVLPGDRVSTGDKARTELEIDYANTLRLAEHTQANITQLTRSQIQIQLGRGMANYTVYRGSDADAEIDTPNVAIKTERRESSFRILVTADDHTEVLVRKGEVEVTTPQGGTRVAQGQFITIQGAGADTQYKIGDAPARDDWDQWNTDRDNMIRNSEARKHTNDYYVGTENLDGHGTWSEVPDYGPVWRPAEPAGWAPYRNGRWVYEPYWGWTWVSYDDWGWAPYHYGRWMYLDGGWGWWPGPAYGYPFYRPTWAPAYVSFCGFGGGFGIGVGFGWGSIGWLPLGPGDFFHPWWGRWGGGYGYGRFGGFHGGFTPLRAGSRFSNVNLAMHDRNFRGGTTVSGREFGTGHMSAQAMTHAQFQNARMATGRLPVTPGRESFSASGRSAAAATTRGVSQNQHFFSARGASRGTTATGSNGRSFSNGREGGGSNLRSNAGGERGFEGRNSGAVNRSGSSGGAMVSRGSSGNSGGWQKFTPMAPRSSSDAGRSGASGGRESMGSQGREGRESTGRESGGAENRGSYGSSRGYGSEGRSYGSDGRSYGSVGRGYGGSSRPPLNMRQPIVTPRSYGGGAYGGGRTAPGYGGARSAPSYGGGRPSYGGGGGHSAPSNHGGGVPSHGGGSSHGGGGSSHGGGGGGGRHGR